MSDGKRYALTGPRGVSHFLDALNTLRESHTITVYGTDDLNRRLAEAEALGVRDRVTYHELEEGE